MFRTFDDFVHLATQKYKLPFEVAKKFIENRLQIKKLSPIDVICFINWAGGDCLTQKQIGEQLNISQQSVMGHLQKLKRVWSYLFNFGPKIPPFNIRYSVRGKTMNRLQVDVSSKSQKF